MKFLEIPIQTVNQNAIDDPKDEDINVAYCLLDLDEIAAFYDNGTNTTVLLKTGDSFVSAFTYREFKEALNSAIKIN